MCVQLHIFCKRFRAAGADCSRPRREAMQVHAVRLQACLSMYRTERPHNGCATCRQSCSHHTLLHALPMKLHARSSIEAFCLSCRLISSD